MRCKHIPLDTFKVDSGFHLLVTITTALDYEQSLFFLGPSSKTPVTRKWPCAWLKARYGSPRFSCLAASLLNARARALPLLNLKKNSDCSQSTTASPNNYDQIVGSDYMKTTLEIDWSEFRPSDRCRRRRCDRYYLWKGTDDLTGRSVYLKTGLESVSQTSLLSGREELFSYNRGRWTFSLRERQWWKPANVFVRVIYVSLILWYIYRGYFRGSRWEFNSRDTCTEITGGKVRNVT